MSCRISYDASLCQLYGHSSQVTFNNLPQVFLGYLIKAHDFFNVDFSILTIDYDPDNNFNKFDHLWVVLLFNDCLNIKAAGSDL